MFKTYNQVVTQVYALMMHARGMENPREWAMGPSGSVTLYLAANVGDAHPRRDDLASVVKRMASDLLGVR